MTVGLTVLLPMSEKVVCANVVVPKNIIYPYGVDIVVQVCATLGSIGFHNLMFGSVVPIARPLPVTAIPAFATIVTDPVAKLYLLPVIIAVAFALTVALPIDKLTLLPVTEIVDKYYSEVQKMGGNRWDTSSLIRRLSK